MGELVMVVFIATLHCPLSLALDKHLVGIPQSRVLDGSSEELPYVMVADDAFPLRTNIMKPFLSRGLSLEQRIFTYRLSRARQIVKNTFGLLASRFCVFLSPMLLSPDNVVKVTLASCVLHIFLRERLPSRYTSPGSFESECLENGRVDPREWRSEGNGEMRPVNAIGSDSYTAEARQVRERVCLYFNSCGSVSWQERFVHS